MSSAAAAAERVRIGNTATCEDCGEPLDDCTCGAGEGCEQCGCLPCSCELPCLDCDRVECLCIADVELTAQLSLF